MPVGETGTWLSSSRTTASGSSAAFIALESVGIPLPAEAALIAAGFSPPGPTASTFGTLIAAGIVAAIVGEIVGFWIGRRYGHQLSGATRLASRLDTRTHTDRSVAVRQIRRPVRFHRAVPADPAQHGGRACRYAMPWRSTAFTSPAPRRASAWILCYGLAAYSFGEAFRNPGLAGGGGSSGLAAAATVLVGAGVHRALREAPAGESRQPDWPSARQLRPREAKRWIRAGLCRAPAAADQVERGLNAHDRGGLTCRSSCRQTRAAPRQAPP